MDLWFPTWLRVSSQAVTQVSNTASERSIFSSRSSTITRSGDYMRYRISLANANDRASNAEKAKMRSLISALRGPSNRIWYSPADYVQRGSFPSQELLTNNTFANGTTGWTADTSYWSTSASDRRYRGTRVSRQADGNGAGIASQAVTTVSYATYCLRAYVRNLVGNTYTYIGISGVGNLTAYTAAQTALIASGYTTASTSLGFTMSSIAVASNGESAGDAVEIEFASVARCMLVDNSPNALTYSAQLDNAAWTKYNSSVTANGAAGPNGLVTADVIVEAATTSEHCVYQSASVSASAADYCTVVVASPNNRGWCYAKMTEATGGTVVTAYFNLSGATAGSIVTGSNWSNARTFIKPLGGGYYLCALVARKTNSATSITIESGSATADNTKSYLGTSGLNAINVSGIGFAQSSVPFIPAQTTTTASTGTSQTGNTLNVKGLPVSTNGLLLEGDLVQIGKQIIPVVSSLNSDAAGCGTLMLAYPPVSAPADNDPVIVNTPMGYFKAANNENGYSCAPGGFSDFELELEEALA